MNREAHQEPVKAHGKCPEEGCPENYRWLPQSERLRPSSHFPTLTTPTLTLQSPKKAFSVRISSCYLVKTSRKTSTRTLRARSSASTLQIVIPGKFLPGATASAKKTVQRPVTFQEQLFRSPPTRGQSRKTKEVEISRHPINSVLLSCLWSTG